MKRLLFSVLCVLLVVLNSATQTSVMAEPANSKQPRKRVVVPPELTDWTASVAIVPQNGPHRRYSRPRVEFSHDGGVAIRGRAGADLNQRMEQAEAKELFGFLAECTNRFYLTNSEGKKYGPSEMHDANDSKSYRVRLASGARAVELTLEQAQPARMGFEPLFFSVIAGVNRQLRQEGIQDRLPEPFPLDASYRDPEIDENRPVVPDQFSRQWEVTFQIVSKSQNAEVRVLHTDAQAFGLYPLQTTEWLSVSVDGIGRRHETSQRDLSRVLSRSARTIVNQFELRSAAPQKERGSKVRVGVSQGRRGIIVEFDDTDAIPLEWHTELSVTIEAVNGLIETDQKKIEPIHDPR
ncbi:MAG: hypothetical protein HY290_18415 [Planctomycetia bacterium]|nr:hypothetical protein [Planctomycetia bacterium]